MPKKSAPKSTCQTQLPTWRELPLGGVVTEPGNTEHYSTGNWTTRTTCWIKESCINCNLCWPVCPHDAIRLDTAGNMAGVDETKCTNCTLCIAACPTKPKSLVEKDKKQAKI